MPSPLMFFNNGTGPTGATGPVGATGPQGAAGTTVSITSNYFNGYMGASGSWAVTSTGFTQPINTGGNTLTTLFWNGITVSAAGSSLPAIIFQSGNTSAVYEVTANCLLSSNTGGSDCAARLVVGSTPFAFGGMNSATSPDNVTGVSVKGMINPMTASTLQIMVQLCSLTNQARIGTLGEVSNNVPAIQWSILQIN